MPKAYESMRNKFAKGAAKDSPEYDAAQSKAAAIYNAKHKDSPMTGKKKSKKKKRKKAKPASRGGIAQDIFGKEY
jgi:hypothetical protein